MELEVRDAEGLGPAAVAHLRVDWCDVLRLDRRHGGLREEKTRASCTLCGDRTFIAVAHNSASRFEVGDLAEAARSRLRVCPRLGCGGISGFTSVFEARVGMNPPWWGNA